MQIPQSVRMYLWTEGFGQRLVVPTCHHLCGVLSGRDGTPSFRLPHRAWFSVNVNLRPSIPLWKPMACGVHQRIRVSGNLELVPQENCVQHLPSSRAAVGRPPPLLRVLRERGQFVSVLSVAASVLRWPDRAVLTEIAEPMKLELSALAFHTRNLLAPPPPEQVQSQGLYLISCSG